MIMWNELGLSGGTAIYYFDCAVFRHQMGSEKWNQRSLQCHYWKENGRRCQKRKRIERTRI